jgi:hypothetical protein
MVTVLVFRVVILILTPKLYRFCLGKNIKARWNSPQLNKNIVQFICFGLIWISPRIRRRVTFRINQKLPTARRRKYLKMQSGDECLKKRPYNPGGTAQTLLRTLRPGPFAVFSLVRLTLQPLLFDSERGSIDRARREHKGPTAEIGCVAKTRVFATKTQASEINGFTAEAQRLA